MTISHTEEDSSVTRVCYGTLQAQIMPSQLPTHMEDIALDAIPKRLWAQKAPDKDTLVSLILWYVFQRWMREVQVAGMHIREIMLQLVVKKGGQIHEAHLLVNLEKADGSVAEECVRLERDTVIFVPIFTDRSGHELTVLVGEDEVLGTYSLIEYDLNKELPLDISKAPKNWFRFATWLTTEYLIKSSTVHDMELRVIEDETSGKRIHVITAKYDDRKREPLLDAWPKLRESHPNHLIVSLENAYQFLNEPDQLLAILYYLKARSR